MTFVPWRRSSSATNVRRGAKVGFESSYPCCRVKRSWYRIANWFIAAFQLCAARLQSAVMLRSASHISLLAASSDGKWPRVLMILRSCAFTLSTWYRRGMDFSDALQLAQSGLCSGLATFDKHFSKAARRLDLKPAVSAPG